MHAHSQILPHAGLGPSDRAGDNATPSSGAARARFPLRPTAFRPITYALMHLTMAITVAYALTRDWRIALGVGVIEPMVQAVAYMLHEKAWSIGGRKQVRGFYVGIQLP